MGNKNQNTKALDKVRLISSVLLIVTSFIICVLFLVGPTISFINALISPDEDSWAVVGFGLYIIIPIWFIGIIHLGFAIKGINSFKKYNKNNSISLMQREVSSNPVGNLIISIALLVFLWEPFFLINAICDMVEANRKEKLLAVPNVVESNNTTTNVTKIEQNKSEIVNNTNAHYCSYCGQPVDSDARFCKHCGKEIK